MTTVTTDAGGVGPGRGGRMSRPRKREAVLRLLRGEDPDDATMGGRAVRARPGLSRLGRRPLDRLPPSRAAARGRPAAAGAGRADAGRRAPGGGPGGAGGEPVPRRGPPQGVGEIAP